MINSGISGHQPSVAIRPIERVPFTVGMLKEALAAMPDDLRVVTDAGPLNRVKKILGVTEHHVHLGHVK
jgi:hypothetical protein